MDKKGISGLITLAIALVILAGYFNVKPIGPWVRKAFYDTAFYGSKVVEAPPPQASGNAGAAQACRNNLRQIESAKAKLRDSRAVGSMSWAEVQREMGVRAMPRCPGGGEYILGSQSIAVRCTIGDNGTPSRSDDHRL